MAFLCPGCHARSESVVGLCPSCGYVGRGQQVGPVPCSIEGCNRDPYAKGLCEPHYRRAARGSTSTAPVREPAEPARVVLSLRVPEDVRERAISDPDGARRVLEEWARGTR